METDKELIYKILLEIEAIKLKAQLKAISKLLGKEEERESHVETPKSMSQIDMVINILSEAKTELHITEIISRVKEKYKIDLDRESIVSSLTKKMRRIDGLIRAGKNTFILKHEDK